jgi:hypothetical protein
VGQSAEAVVTLQAANESSVLIDHWETDSADTTVEAMQRPEFPKGRAFRVSQKVTKEGDHRTVVRFIMRTPGHSSETLTMEVFYRGVFSAPGRISDR